MDSIQNNGAIAIVSMASVLLPKGIPDFSVIRHKPSIEQMKSWPEQQGFGLENLHNLLLKLVRNYCSCINVPADKNMTEDQMIEAAGFLLDECDNYRIEDYIIMFTLAKRGKLYNGKTGRMFDHVDIQLISEFKSNYEHLRQVEGEKLHQMDIEKVEKSLPPDPRSNPNEPDEVKKKRFDDILALFKQIRDDHRKKSSELSAIERDNNRIRKEAFEKLIQEAKEAGETDLIKFINDKNFNK